MDPFFWIGLVLWMGLGAAAVLCAVLVWAAIAETREEASRSPITEADWEMLRSWLHRP
jgi:hypothetical protein